MFISFCGISQSLTPTVVASSGEFFSAGSASLSWTLGEVVIDSYFGTNNQLTQGFQQPEIRLLTVEEYNPAIVISVFPNPTTDILNFSITGLSNSYQVAIFDMSGKLIAEKLFTEFANTQFDLSAFESGIYLMQIKSGNELIKTIKIEKN